VLCWSEKHDQRLANLDDSQLLDVGRLWQSEFNLLQQDPTTRQIVMFENSGAEVGVSNHHPHGQVYATSFITDNGERLRRSQQRYSQQNEGRSLLQDLIARKEYQRELLVEQHRHCRTIVPYAARFPYETWIVPERHVSTIAELSDEERDDMVLASAKQSRLYDALFGRVSPNITLFFNAPVDHHPGNRHWCYHIVQQPPLRDAKRMKYLAGFESAAANIINPVQPEQAAQQLRAANIQLEDKR
jgi:UDPglucose--hexose-1-phosphate uridylyltransferase